MLGKNFQYRGQTFFDTDFDKVTGQGIVIQSCQWADTNTSDDQQNRQGTHGIQVSPTFLRGRVINIQGLIVADSRAQREIERQKLIGAFSPEPFPGPDNKGFYDFEFIGDDGNDYVIRAKVLSTPGYDTDLGSVMFTRWQAQLISEVSYYESKIQNQQIHVEGFYGGKSFPTKFPVPFDTYGYTANVINNGNWPAPLKTTITANENTGPNMRVVNTANDSYIGIKTPMAGGDILVIDTKNNLITLNGSNVSGDRISGSIYKYVNPGNNQFIVRDDLQRVGDGLAVDVLFEWPETFI